jgi:iron complex transport system substrate-binding protein
MPNLPLPSRRSVRPAIAALLVCAFAATACGSSDDDDSAGKSGAAKVQVTDATGARISVPSAPSRVVTLSEMDLDSALTLGVRPVGLSAGRGQKGAPGYLADKVRDVPVVGAVTGPDIEKIVQAKPDVILAGQLADKQVLEQLQRIAPTVVTINDAKNWKSSLELAGTVLGKTKEAQAFLASYDTKVAALKNDLGPNAGANVSVARYSSRGTAIMQQGVFISDILNDLGFKRPGLQAAKGDGHSTPISDENLAEIDGDWLFIGTLTAPEGGANLTDELARKPAYQQLKAVTGKHATVIDGTKWTSLGGAQAAVSILDDIRKPMVG